MNYNNTQRIYHLSCTDSNALNGKINQETLSCNKLEFHSRIGRGYLWPGAHRREKAALTLKCNTHLAAMDNVVPVPAVVIHHIDVIQVGVGPVHQLLDHIQCNSRGLLNFIIHQLCSVGAIHVAALHLGHVAIVGEKQHSAEGNHSNLEINICCLLCWENNFLLLALNHVLLHLYYFIIIIICEMNHFVHSGFKEALTNVINILKGKAIQKTKQETKKTTKVLVILF